MKFGVAKDLITPDIRTSMGGYHTFHGKTFAGIHDDLYVRALFIDDGTTKLLFLSVELLFHDFALTKTIGRFAEDVCGISPDGVFVSYTHTHGGPAVRGFGDPGQCSADYEAFLLARLKSCIRRAMLNRFEGTAEYGLLEGDWNINRRRQVNGVMQLAPNPEGARDTALHVLKFVDARGEIKALTVHYACHPVTVRDRPELSGDFPGRICQLLEAEYFGATALFFQGAGGNMRPKITARGNAFATLTYEEVNEMAVAIVARIRQAIVRRDAFRPLQVELAACQFAIALELEPWPKRRFEQIAADEREPVGLRRIAEGIAARYEQIPDEVKLPGGVVRLSRDLYIVYMGGEPCYEVMMNLAPIFPGKRYIFIGYADSLAYIPDDRLLAEGGYEAEGSIVEYGLKGTFKNVDARMEREFVRALRQIDSPRTGAPYSGSGPEQERRV